MRLFLAIILSCSTLAYGWPDKLMDQVEVKCHVVQGEHHEEALADHAEEHHAFSEKESHDPEKDCQPEHCSDHCTICHTSISGQVFAPSDKVTRQADAQNQEVIDNSGKPSSISLRPDTPPPKA